MSDKPTERGQLGTWLWRLLCPHRWMFSRNIYGDEIIACGYKRSIYQCDFCGKQQFRPNLAPIEKEFS